MDILKMLSELRSERSQIEEAILTLERLASGKGKRRGRPPKWMSQAQHGEPAQASEKGTVSPRPRKRRAAAQRKREATPKKG